MSDILFSCPHCEEHVSIDADGAGLQVACPHCSKEVQVPNATTEQAATQSTLPATAQQKEQAKATDADDSSTLETNAWIPSSEVEGIAVKTKCRRCGCGNELKVTAARRTYFGSAVSSAYVMIFSCAKCDAKVPVATTIQAIMDLVLASVCWWLFYMTLTNPKFIPESLKHSAGLVIFSVIASILTFSFIRCGWARVLRPEIR